MDRGAWWATVHGVAKNRTRLSDFTHSLAHLTFQSTLMFLSCFFIWMYIFMEQQKEGESVSVGSQALGIPFK